ncbi:hypothetical protein [Vibrio sp. SCSIO 43137]|uniref:hypothetical protein n=1 Tax=Vibrio sp. SCSIO 43137 TaxID=3021011 RepID=UPI002307C88D|nr:hypothetical protein [Vibrio sp. SCSIO 43137]WCE32377.1 hypothetical protein PK654_17955 [Vibrio sp. SCSIO 43137]
MLLGSGKIKKENETLRQQIAEQKQSYEAEIELLNSEIATKQQLIDESSQQCSLGNDLMKSHLKGCLLITSPAQETERVRSLQGWLVV